MKPNKSVIVFPVIAVIVGGLSISPAYAAPIESPVPVSYDNTQQIETPHDPLSATWGVSIPARVVFTDKSLTVEVGVKLVNIPTEGTEGINSIETSTPILVKVKSVYHYNLKHGSEELEYILTYGDTVASGEHFMEIAQLHSTNIEVSGNAVIIGAPVIKGVLTDILTYQITDPYKSNI